MRGKVRIDGRKHVETSKGFPIIIYLTKDRKEKLILTGYHSKKEHWDGPNALPTKNHPHFLDLLNFLERTKIRLNKLLDKARYENIPFVVAEQFLKGNDSGIFYKDAIEMSKGLSRPYGIAVNSFNKYFPDYPYSFITKETAVDFMNKLSATMVRGRKRSPNGVLSYMDSLTSMWNKLGRPDNPFSGIKPKAVPTKSKALTDQDMVKLKNNTYLKHGNSKSGGKYNYVNYLLLCFYLGGIDLVDLKNLRYDTNVINGRVEFTRSKGGTNVFVSNKIFPEAFEILENYKCKPYLVPLNEVKNYNNFIPNISRYFPDIMNELELSKIPYSKSARYTFIQRAQLMLIDERITIEIVGHSQSSTHSIYKDEFPYHVRDEAHKKIIELTIY